MAFEPTPIIAKAQRKAARYSLCVRIYINILFLIWLSWLALDLFVTVYNLVAVYLNRAQLEWFVGWTAAGDSGNALQIALILVPRELVILSAFTGLILHIFLQRNFKKEPEVHLPNYIPSTADYPTVDIFLPRYKEPWELYRQTLAAALTLDYPADKLRVYVLDDGRKDPVRDHVEEEFGFGKLPAITYLQRPDGTHAKAGNLNHAFARSSGQMIAVLDADHVAKKDFLTSVMPHLLTFDPATGKWEIGKVALCQTKQFFHNENQFMAQLTDGKNDCFASLSMLGYNGIDAGLCCGTGYLALRAALETTNGWEIECSVEDVTTSLALNGKGWVTRATDQKVAVGVCPETLSEFYAQRARWTAGNTQLLMYKLPRVRAGMDFIRWLAYFTSNFSVFTITFLLFAWLYRIGGWYAFKIATRNTIQESNLYCSTNIAIPGTWFCWVGSVLLTAEFSTLLIFLLLPRVPFWSKIMGLVGMTSQIPICLYTLKLLVAGRLRPGKRYKNFKSAGEAAGDAGFPRLAYISLALSSIVIAMNIIMLTVFGSTVNSPTDIFAICMAFAFVISISLSAWIGFAQTGIYRVRTALHRLLSSRPRQPANKDIAMTNSQVINLEVATSV